jgi:hypothetical protein
MLMGFKKKAHFFFNKIFKKVRESTTTAKLKKKRGGGKKDWQCLSKTVRMSMQFLHANPLHQTTSKPPVV